MLLKVKHKYYYIFIKTFNMEYKMLIKKWNSHIYQPYSLLQYRAACQIALH